MTRAKQMFAILAVTTLGIWGCTKGPTPISCGDANRLKELEAKFAQREQDFRAAATERDQLRKRLAAAEEQQKQLRTELEQKAEQAQASLKERDELRQQIQQRTTERDATQVQFEQFRKNIRNLLGQADAAANRTDQQPVTSSAVVASPGPL